MKFLQGFKINIFSILTAAVPMISEPVANFVSSNPGWSGVIVGTIMFLLRSITSKPGLFAKKQ